MRTCQSRTTRSSPNSSAFYRILPSKCLGCKSRNRDKNVQRGIENKQSDPPEVHTYLESRQSEPLIHLQTQSCQGELQWGTHYWADSSALLAEIVQLLDICMAIVMGECFTSRIEEVTAELPGKQSPEPDGVADAASQYVPSVQY